MKLGGVCLLVLSGLLYFGAAVAPAAPADLDHSFGRGGIVDVEGQAGPSFSSESSARMAIGPGDEIFVLYSTPGPCSGVLSECTIGLSVARYDSSGHRDPSFGTGAGSQFVVHQNPLAYAFALAVDPDGKPVVAASDSGTMTIGRFDTAGHLDGTFGSAGVIHAGFPGGVFSSPAVAVQPDDKIVAGAEGASEPQKSSELLLARFLPNGERDPGFGKGGEVVTTLPTRSRPAGILLGAGGSISVAGPQCCGGSPLFGEGFSYARFLPGGQPDPALAGSGEGFFPTPGTQATVEADALAPDGGIFVVFEEETSQVSSVGNMVKLTPSGAVDSSFGSGGRLRLFNRVGAITPSGIAVDSKGRIVGVGWDGQMAVFRLRADGSADRTFNGGQRVTTPFGGNQEAPLGIAIQSSGRIVALGETSCCGPRTFALVALKGGTDRSRCLGHRATIVGTNGPDEITGTPRRDVIAALGGKDTVRGLAGADLICGGKGRDKLLGGPGRDEVRP